jgi:hypothetical protein
MRLQHSAEMSLSREEFFRLLPAAVGRFEESGNTVRGYAGGCRWSIGVVRLDDRRAGSVVVPRHRVDLVIEGCAEAEAEAFMERFRRGFLRGGG